MGVRYRDTSLFKIFFQISVVNAVNLSGADSITLVNLFYAVLEVLDFLLRDCSYLQKFIFMAILQYSMIAIGLFYHNIKSKILLRN